MAMISGKVFKVFLSSTYSDLKEYRRAAINAVETFDELKAIAMEFFMAQPEEPSKLCSEEIEDCDFFVGIYAYRYGFIPDRENISITQAEYELAKKLRKPCLCFIVHEDHPWKLKLVETDKLTKLKAFLSKIKSEQAVAFFTTTVDFREKLAHSLHKLLLANRRGTENTDLSEKMATVPRPPTPYIAHPYPITEYFTGRNAERAGLSDWFFNDDAPMMIMEAIGGMGKSALTWVWLQQDIVARSVPFTGAFWWSFYEGNYDDFLWHLCCYTLARENIRQDEPMPNVQARTNAALQSQRFLLVLDGFERALRGYYSMEAAYMQEQGFAGTRAVQEEWDLHQREPVDPGAARFLQHLCAGKTKTLMTTRLFPTPLEGLAGIRRKRLSGLSPDDAVDFLRAEGVKGMRAELQQAADVYAFHPLMLKHLSSAIQRSRTRDISKACKHNIVNKKEPQKILNQSFALLSEQEKRIATGVAVFRKVFAFDAARVIFPDLDQDELWNYLQELRKLGFLFYDEDQGRFDFHPVIRSFLYDHLTRSLEVHSLAAAYFQALPAPVRVVSLEDLAPVIEHYFHLVKARKYDIALELFRARLETPTYFQLSAYRLRIKLLGELFPSGLDKWPRLNNARDQAWALNSLANSYSLAGRPATAGPLYLSKSELREKDNDEKNLATGLGSMASTVQLTLCRLSAASVHLHKRVAVCQRIEDESRESVGHQELGLVLAYQGRSGLLKESGPSHISTDFAEGEFDTSTAYWERIKDNQGLSLVYAYRSLLLLMLSRLSAQPNKRAGTTQAAEAFTNAHRALCYAEEFAEQGAPIPRDFVQAYCLSAGSLIQCILSNAAIANKTITLYGSRFQDKTETITVGKGEELVAAERCLTEALQRSRMINLVEFESDILLTLARLDWVRAKTNGKASGPKILTDLTFRLEEAHDIAQRSGYRIKLADIHLFCAQVLREILAQQRLLDMDLATHLEQAKDFSLDQSTFEDLFKSKDPNFYDGIPEYAMLKRGMTLEEKIENGYWFGYKMAEAIERQSLA